jgi:hypothetical protein
MLKTLPGNKRAEISGVRGRSREETKITLREVKILEVRVRFSGEKS